MSSHLLLVSLALIASATYLGSRLISLVPRSHYDDGDPDGDFDDAASDDDEPTDADDDDGAVVCGSMAEARAVVIAGRQEGDEVLIHERGCAEYEGFDCDCDAVPFTVGEKVEA